MHETIVRNVFQLCHEPEYSCQTSPARSASNGVSTSARSAFIGE